MKKGNICINFIFLHTNKTGKLVKLLILKGRVYCEKHK